MFARALLKKDGDAIARITNAPSKFLQFGFQKFIISALNHISEARLQRT